MAEREVALGVLDTYGHLSKNVLARTLKCSLQEAAEVLETLTNIEGFKTTYVRRLGNKIEFLREKLEGCRVYAVSRFEDPNEIFKVEMMLRERFYEGDQLVYPPCDSGIYLQEKRNVFINHPHSSTVKPIANRKITPPKIISSTEDDKTVTFSEKSEVLGERNKLESGEINDSEGKVRFRVGENTPIGHVKLLRKATPYPKREKSEAAMADGEKKKGVRGKVTAGRAEKKVKPVEEYFVPTLPVVMKKRVKKTRSFVENGKLVSEDYSSEEEVIVNRTPIPIANKKPVQSKLDFQGNICKSSSFF